MYLNKDKLKSSLLETIIIPKNTPEDQKEILKQLAPGYFQTEETIESLGSYKIYPKQTVILDPKISNLSVYFNWFENNIKYADYLYVSAEIKTQLKEAYTYLNYGMRIDFWINESETYSITFDMNSFNGNLYDLKNYTQQGALINFKNLKNITYGIKAIYLFCNSSLEEPFEFNNEYIKFHNISLHAVSENDLDDKYTTDLLIINNNNLSPEQDTISLQPQLLFNNNILKNERIYDVEWFYRDNSVNYNTKGDYNPLIGQGWRKFFPTEDINANNKLSITNNEIKLGKFPNIVYRPDNFINEKEIKCLFKESKNNTYFETPSIILYNKFDSNFDYNFKLKTSVDYTNEDKWKAIVYLSGNYPLDQQNWTELEYKWYVTENGYWNGEPNNNQIGLLKNIDTTNNDYIPTDEKKVDEAKALSQIDLGKMVKNWDGTIQVFCDIYGIKKNTLENITERKYLATRTLNFSKTINLEEFSHFFEKYNEKLKNSQTTWISSKNAIDYCKREGIFNSEEWKRFITLEETVIVIYNMLKEKIEQKERNNSNPYIIHLTKFLNKYFNEQNKKLVGDWGGGRAIWDEFQGKKYVQDNRPQAWATKEEVLTILYRILRDRNFALTFGQ